MESILDSGEAISHYASYNGVWNASRMEGELPEDIIQRIENFNPPTALQQDDEFNWGATPDGVFTTKLAYSTIQGGSNRSTLPIFNTIWKWNGTERIRTLLWKLGHGTVLTNVDRQRRQMATSGLCPICSATDESLLHCFRDCRKNLSIWYSLKVRNHHNFFNTQNWQHWLETNLSKKEN